MWKDVMKYKILLLLFLFGLYNCGQQPTTVSGDLKDEILKITDPIVDNILTSYNDGKYENYSKDFDDNFKKILTAEKFKEVHSMMLSKIGKFKQDTKKVVTVQQSGQYFQIVYSVEFEKDNAVKVRVVYKKADDNKKNQIAALYFKSDKF